MNNHDTGWKYRPISDRVIVINIDPILNVIYRVCGAIVFASAFLVIPALLEALNK